MEALLVALGLLTICAVTFALTRVAAAGLRRTAGYFLTGVSPPSLAHLTSIVAAWLEERQSAEVSRQGREPPPLPEIVISFRAFTARFRTTMAGQSSG